MVVVSSESVSHTPTSRARISHLKPFRPLDFRPASVKAVCGYEAA